MTVIPFLLLLVLGWAGWLLRVATAKVVSVTGTIPPAGQFRYHYDNNHDDAAAAAASASTGGSSCQTLLLIGVGTAMSVMDYDHLGTTMVNGTNIVLVLLDANPGNIVKTNEIKFATLANALASTTNQAISVCGTSSSSPGYIIVGGHSASGQAALQALDQNLYHFTVGGFLGLDPYQVTTKNAIAVPSIHFGFSSTTCGVSIDEAAQEGYLVSHPDHRVLYRMDNTHGPSGSSKQRATHCSFTDAGCFHVVCPAHDASAVWHMVAHGMHDFVQALATNNEVFTHASFSTPFTGVTVFVGTDPVTNVDTSAHNPDTTTPLQPALLTG